MSDTENDRSDNVGIALGLVVAAGASTGLGAAVVFFPSIVKLASRRVLAGSLGFSAGVMTYVSFIEIFQKAQLGFEDAGHKDHHAYAYATLCFFGGVLVMLALNMLVAKLVGGHSHYDVPEPPTEDVHKKPTTRDDIDTKGDCDLTCCAKDPVNQLEKFQKMASVLQHEKEDGPGKEDAELDVDDDFVDNLPLKTEEKKAVAGEEATDPDVTEAQTAQEKEAAEENDRLVKMGMNTALAIGLHNFPEGLATFVATLDDPKVGSILAFAIAIHNIPEGLCVALPIFYATGNRRNAFLWALLSGASEFVAALLGWAVLANSFSDNAYSVLFGLVAGMMVIISVRELLPTAHFYDPEDTVVTYSYIGGMLLMAFSLVLFQL